MLTPAVHASAQAEVITAKHVGWRYFVCCVLFWRVVKGAEVERGGFSVCVEVGVD